MIIPTSSRVTLRAPRQPEAPPPHRFPLFATIAPVVASVALWMVTRSAFALAFAALGPVVAGASGLDARVQRRRTMRRERARFAGELTATHSAVEEAHAAERRELEARMPAVRQRFDLLRQAVGRWRGSVTEELAVRIGRGPVRSGIDLRADATADFAGPQEGMLKDLVGAAAIVVDAPVSLDARRGIGFVGRRPVTLAAARGVVLQLALALSPQAFVVSGPREEREWDWLDELPHERVPGADAMSVTFTATGRAGASPARSGRAAEDGEQRVVVATATAPASLPRGIREVIELDGAGEASLSPDPGRASGVIPAPAEGCIVSVEFVAEEEAVRLARELAECARAEGISAGRAALPDLVEFSTLPRESGDVSPVGLRCVLGRSEQGDVELDLVRDGPHAIVGGTTGSGKSELLLSWMLAIAAHRSPAEVAFLFVDFKGGASFDPLVALPHCVGVITDLDEQEASRALSSLSAELRRRERTLAEHRLRSIDEAGDEQPFARLIVVVDEYAALLDAHSALHSVFVDIASRGRSLGVHVILCTQRPAGVVRESILANCGLRISLRVTSAADSSAVIGTGDAAELSATPRGRAFASIAGAAPQLLQVARSSRADVRAVADRWAGARPPRRPWLPPLPALIPASALDDERIARDVPFAIVDLPEQQSQHTARFDPIVHGSMFVVGGPGSGKSGLLEALQSGRSLTERAIVPSALPNLWDALCETLEDHPVDPGAGQPPQSSKAHVLLIDDIDAIVTSTADEYQGGLLDLLQRALREGPSRGVRLVLTAQRIPGALQSVAALCGTRVFLGMPSRQEYVLAGGEPGEFRGGLPAGAGHWNGQRFQVVRAGRPSHPGSADEGVGGSVPEPRPSPPKIRLVDLRAHTPLAVVSTSPERMAASLRALSGDRRVITLDGQLAGTVDARVALSADRGILVGDPDSWQSHWNTFGALRRAAELLFDGCTILEVRSLTRVREIPPPFARSERPLWSLGTDGRLLRARLG